MDNKVKTTIDATDTRPGYRFGIPAAIPGMLAAGAIMLGAPVVGAVALAVALAAVALAAVALGAVGAVGAAAVAAVAVAAVAAGAGAAAGVAAVAVALAGAGVAAVAAVALAGAGVAAVAADLDYPQKYSPKKIFRGAMGGSVLGAALTYGAAVNAPQAPVPAEKSAPPSTLTIAPQGGDLCRDFKLSENTTATAGTDAQGQTTYTLTVPKGCALTP